MRPDDRRGYIYILNSGKEYYADDGIVGLGSNWSVLHGGAESFEEIRNGENDAFAILEPEEAVEIAEYMIEQWKQFKRHWKAKI